MHIEPGLISQAKIAMANVAATGVLLSYARGLITRPTDIVRTLLATIFFTFFMQSFSTSVGPSELHFVGAIAMYLTLGFVPTLIGFAAGLLLQAIVFDPRDMMNLAANALTLITPLIAMHYTLGRKLREGAKINFQQILKMDTMYYAGVVGMVGFWLSMSAVATPFAAWATFASSYLVVVAFEPVFTYVTVRLLKDHQDKKWVKTCFAVSELKLAK